MKMIALLALSTLGLQQLRAQSVYTSTGDGDWDVSFSLSGSGTPIKYVIRAGDSIYVNTSSTSNIDTIDVYGILSFGTGKKVNLTSGGIVLIQSGAKVVDGSSGSKFDFATGTDVPGPFNVSGPAYATSGTGGNFILGPLPVTWLDFNVLAAGKDAQISWSTASEHNTLEFELQISQDGLNWIALHNTTAAGNSNITNHYNYIHQDPGAGMHLYQVKLIEQNGSFSYSDKRFLMFSERGTLFCSPNPVSDLLYIHLPGGASIKSAQIYNLNGALMPAAFEPMSNNSLDMKSLNAGMYILKVLMEDGTMEQIKVIRS